MIQMDFPVLKEDGEMVAVSGHVLVGERILNRIYEKTHKYSEKYGDEPKYVILDSQSYLHLYAFIGHPQIEQPLLGMTPIVLPQIKRRIQVIGDEPLFTATETVASRQ